MHSYFRLTFIRESRHGGLKDLVISGLSAHSGTHNHESMTHLYGIVQLYDFIHKGFRCLEVLRLSLVGDLFQELSVVNLWLNYTGEQILDDIFEQREVVFEKFRYIDVSESSEKEQVFVHIGVLRFKYSCSVDDGSHGSHAVIVVVLGGELFRRKFKSRDHFLGERTTGRKSERIEHDLAYHGIIGDHHGDGSE